MTDPQPESTQTEQHPTADQPERLPWVSPRLDSINFQEAEHVAGPTGDSGSSHS
jgi:hypothetical protein